MRKFTIPITLTALIAVLLTSGLLVGCQGFVVKGSGNLETEKYNLSDFTRVDVSSAFEADIVQSSSYSVSITADDKNEVEKDGDI